MHNRVASTRTQCVCIEMLSVRPCPNSKYRILFENPITNVIVSWQNEELVVHISLTSQFYTYTYMYIYIIYAIYIT